MTRSGQKFIALGLLLFAGLFMCGAQAALSEGDCYECTSRPSQPPTPTPPETRQEPKQQAAPPQKSATQENSGTESAPFVVKIAPSPDAQPESKDQRKDREEKASQDWWTLIFVGITGIATAFLFVATAALWLVTYRLWQTTSKAVADGAAALLIANKEFRATHRPRLVLRQAFSLISDPEDTPILVTYVIANVGGTSCWMTEGHIGIELVPEA